MGLEVEFLLHNCTKVVSSYYSQIASNFCNWTIKKKHKDRYDFPCFREITTSYFKRNKLGDTYIKINQWYNIVGKNRSYSFWYV